MPAILSFLLLSTIRLLFFCITMYVGLLGYPIYFLNVFFWLALDGKNIHLALLLSEVVELAKHPPPPLAERRSGIRITRS